MTIARTASEARLYLDLLPCEVCGELDTRWRLSALLAADGAAAERYAGVCAACGTDREYVFELAHPSGELSRFGGVEPSRLLDAAQWLEVATAAETAAVNAGHEAGARRADLGYAADAVREAMKFLPDGGAQVPAEELFSEHGARVGDEEPWRLTRDWMESLLADYAELLAAPAEQVGPAGSADPS